ncbi:MAG: chromosome segregation SMC family protein [Candidatus Nanohaloarchaea archaeon]|nr:chromosome segregation SMC family protein [Candidatus Nanohaloarchaea archaeon]
MDRTTAINKLYMKGFKSFNRQTAIPFYDGMTAIVGSNGSGKSNIIDALSFVMGKRSSQLRAEKLEQLIFNGGEDGTPADEAVVRLHLDNESGVFDEFCEEDSPDEIRIGRKITRNGYSTYRFQGSNCKRSKIDAILDAAGIDPDGYHFVEQGRITSIVNQTPGERRKIIDRISGIASYEDKRDKAEEELEQVQERLQELEIKKEMKKDRLEQLEQEKEDAEQYQELEQKKQTLTYSIKKMRLRELENQVDQLGEDKKEEKVEELEDSVDKLDDRLDELEQEKDEIEEQIDEQRDSTLQQEIERIKNKIQNKKDKIETKREQIQNIDSLLDDYQKLSQYQGRDRAVKKVLDTDIDGVHGTVSQLVHFDDQYAVAIETAAGKRMDNIIVQSEDVATKCVNYLKRNNIGRATFLPLDKVSARSRSSSSKRAVKKPGVIDFALELVDYDSQYRDAVSHVLGDTLVAEDLDSVKGMGRIRAVTLDGDIMRKGGSITGGKKKQSRSKRKKQSGSSDINPEEKKKQKEQLEDEIQDLKKEIGNLNQLLEEKQQEEEEQSSVASDLKDQRQECRDQIKEVRQERKEKAEELERLRNELGNVQKKRAKFETEIDNIKEELEEFDDLSEDDMLEDDVSNLRSKRTRTINKMNELGDVNMRAIKDYQEAKEEFDEFMEKYEQVQDEKQEIQDMIDEIEAKKTKQFMDTLEQVSEEFNRIFSDLFEGGEAHLELEEEEDIDSGLLIKARPPDKDPNVIDSLSGGEKTLTAISFVFALQEYDPAPFYVMDEIDAALDETNSEMLSEILKDYAEEAQLIFISHNEQTVRHADRAYGVSMRDGVSRVRSIELDV